MSLIERLVRFNLGRPEEDPEDLLRALDKAGGSHYLTEEAETKPDAFITPLGWVLEDQ